MRKIKLWTGNGLLKITNLQTVARKLSGGFILSPVFYYITTVSKNSNNAKKKKSGLLKSYELKNVLCVLDYSASYLFQP